jgi:hypothetical protein
MRQLALHTSINIKPHIKPHLGLYIISKRKLPQSRLLEPFLLQDKYRQSGATTDRSAPLCHAPCRAFASEQKDARYVISDIAMSDSQALTTCTVPSQVMFCLLFCESILMRVIVVACFFH